MKILAICQRGNVRSVNLAYILKDERKFKDVIAIGIETTTQETLNMLGDWADKIYIVGEKTIKDQIPIEFQSKIIWLDIGKDVWGNFPNAQLLAILRKKLDGEKVF